MREDSNVIALTVDEIADMVLTWGALPESKGSAVLMIQTYLDVMLDAGYVLDATASSSTPTMAAATPIQNPPTMTPASAAAKTRTPSPFDLRRGRRL